MYTHDNVMLSGTHTHSGPAGYSHYPMYDLTSFGFYQVLYSTNSNLLKCFQDNFDVIVNGIVSSIKMAHNNLSKGGSIYMNEGTLLDANIK